MIFVNCTCIKYDDHHSCQSCRADCPACTSLTSHVHFLLFLFIRALRFSMMLSLMPWPLGREIHGLAPFPKGQGVAVFNDVELDAMALGERDPRLGPWGER